jgi:hypothetical protein
MTDIAQLLLPNASELELNLVRVCPRQAIDALCESPQNTYASMPVNFLPWLAAEWHLSKFSPYFNHHQDLIDAGLPWLFHRGSLLSISESLQWLGYDNATLEEDEFLVHIDPGTLEADLDLDNIQTVVNSSLPAHARFYRLHHGLDLRAGRFDVGYFDQCLFDDDSGVWMGNPSTDGVKLSFGSTTTVELAAPPMLQPIVTYRERLLTIVIDDSLMQLDSWLLDSEIRLNSIVSISDLTIGSVNQPALDPVIVLHRDRQIAVASMISAIAPLECITQATYTIVMQRPLPIYTWSDQWQHRWTIYYPLIAAPSN